MSDERVPFEAPSEVTVYPLVVRWAKHLGLPAPDPTREPMEDLGAVFTVVYGESPEYANMAFMMLASARRFLRARFRAMVFCDPRNEDRCRRWSRDLDVHVLVVPETPATPLDGLFLRFRLAKEHPALRTAPWVLYSDADSLFVNELRVDALLQEDSVHARYSEIKRPLLGSSWSGGRWAEEFTEDQHAIVRTGDRAGCSSAQWILTPGPRTDQFLACVTAYDPDETSDEPRFNYAIAKHLLRCPEAVRFLKMHKFFEEPEPMRYACFSPFHDDDVTARCRKLCHAVLVPMLVRDRATELLH